MRYLFTTAGGKAKLSVLESRCVTVVLRISHAASRRICQPPAFVRVRIAGALATWCSVAPPRSHALPNFVPPFLRRIRVNTQVRAGVDGRA